ncbi:MAG: helix-turn-helix domain-containing protein [Chloroflexota bacterium]
MLQSQLQAVNGSPFLSMDEVAQRMGVSRATAYERAKAGWFKTFRSGRRVYVHRADFERWEREGHAEPNGTPNGMVEVPTETRQIVAINAEGLTLEIRITVRPEARPTVSVERR